MTTRNKHRQKGNSLVEFALSSSLLILSFSGAFQFGFGFYRYNVIESAASAGARYAAMRTYRTLRGQLDINVNKAAVRNVVVYGTPSPGVESNPVVPGLDPSAVDVDYTLSSTGVPVSVRVGIRSFTVDAIFKRFTFTGKPYVTFPYMGRYAPVEAEP